MKAGRPLAWVAVLCVLAILVAGSWWLLDRRQTSEDVEARPGPEAVPAHAAGVLHDLAGAVTDGDVEAAAALAPAGDSQAGRRLGAVVRNARAWGLTDVTLRYLDQLGAIDPDGRWVATAEVGWTEPDGAARVRAEIAVALQSGPERVAIRGLADGARRPVWLDGPAEVVRRPGAVVISADRTAPEAGARTARTAALASRAVRRVRDLLPEWRGAVVVEVPASSDALDAALAAEPGQYAAVAAVTASVDGSTAADSAVHIFVNPEVFGRLDDRGAQVVMTHEVAHVATGAATTSAPLWLVEGFADHVALREVDLPLSVTAAQVRDQVRRDGVPDRLPGPEEFDTTAAHLGAAYEGAWLVCEVIVDAAGEAALVELYRRVRAGEPLGRTLTSTTGLGEDELLRRWQRRLDALR